eukprot:TRINITY_DN7438_c0_g1_i1.p1 TRINITY_DN7438_c0_g1~~TRINITY_DN7438_c0_g1_i1.p1  ORF type:complete len:631 (+),score=127.04 TRINITY_DN7438_c0_g1_i1:581-2473(+)
MAVEYGEDDLFGSNNQEYNNRKPYSALRPPDVTSRLPAILGKGPRGGPAPANGWRGNHGGGGNWSGEVNPQHDRKRMRHDVPSWPGGPSPFPQQQQQHGMQNRQQQHGQQRQQHGMPYQGQQQPLGQQQHQQYEQQQQHDSNGWWQPPGSSDASGHNGPSPFFPPPYHPPNSYSEPGPHTEASQSWPPPPGTSGPFGHRGEGGGGREGEGGGGGAPRPVSTGGWDDEPETAPRSDNLNGRHTGGSGFGGPRLGVREPFDEGGGGGRGGKTPPLAILATWKCNEVGHHNLALKGASPQIQQPLEVTHYSRTGDQRIHHDDRCLRKFRKPILEERGADLNAGFETYVDKKENGEGPGSPLDALLRSIRHAKVPLEDVHFVTFRNNLNKILGTCYDRNKAWEMGVHKRGKTVYLHVHQEEEPQQSVQDRRNTYYGYAYERAATESRAASPPPPDTPVNANEEYCVVLRTKLGAHRIVMGAEMDCYDGRDSRNQRRYVELKTSKEWTSQRAEENFVIYKLLKFWIQCFLAGVSYAVCGFRNEQGIVLRSRVFTLKDMTEMAKQRNQCWQGGTCLGFADKILCWLYGTLDENEQDCVLRFSPALNRLELLQADSCPPLIEEHCQLMRNRTPTAPR